MVRRIGPDVCDDVRFSETLSQSGIFFNKCELKIQRKTPFFSEWINCAQKSWEGCTRGYCERHCISGCEDCAEYRKKQEEKEEEAKKKEDRLWEEGRTAREEKEREENADFWQDVLEKGEKEAQELDREMKRPTWKDP